MTIYAESSAVLAWLLGETAAHEVARVLHHAERVIASELTLVECDRVLIRAASLGELAEAAAADRHAALAEAAAQWHFLQISRAVLDRARQPFPGEPIRSLDALHLASVLVARSAVNELELLSLDRRVRQTGAKLGFRLYPRDQDKN